MARKPQNKFTRVYGAVKGRVVRAVYTGVGTVGKGRKKDPRHLLVARNLKDLKKLFHKVRPGTKFNPKNCQRIVIAPVWMFKAKKRTP